jgi:hypothetical protein
MPGLVFVHKINRSSLPIYLERDRILRGPAERNSGRRGRGG